MGWIVISLRRGGGKLKALPHGTHQQIQRLDAGRNLIRLKPADGRLSGSYTAGQALLAKPMARPGLADQLTWSHSSEYNL
jgi:hypothetical protein